MGRGNTPVRGFTTILKRYAVGLPAALAVALAGCEQSVQSVAPPVGPATLTVGIQGRNEYYLPVRFTSGARLVLAGKDYRWNATVAPGDTSCVFFGLPNEAYILGISGDGYYSGDAYVRPGARTVDIYRIPGPDFHIDSIQCTLSDLYTLMVRLYLHRPVPPGGRIGAAFFVGFAPDVSDQIGSYYYSTDVTMDPFFMDTATVLKSYLSGWTRIPANQSTRYVTARLTNGATRGYLVDETLYVMSYTNIEHYSNAVASFVY